MKRFLDKRIVIAQDNLLDNIPGSDILKPLYDPFSPAGRKAQQIDLQDDKEKGETIRRSELIVRTNADNKSEALGIFKNNNMSEDDFNNWVEDAYNGLNIPNLQFYQYVIGLWPKMRDKNFTFRKFLSILLEVGQRYKSPEQIDTFFKNFISILPNLEKTLGTSDVVIDKAIDFLISGKGAEEFQDYLLYEMLLRYGLYNEIPENKKSEIMKATETLQKARTNLNPAEKRLQAYYIKRAAFLQSRNKWYEDNALVFLSVDFYNMDAVKNIFEKGVDDRTIQYYIDNFRKGAGYNLFEKSSPLSPDTDGASGKTVGSSAYLFNKMIKVAQEESKPEESDKKAGGKSIPPAVTEDKETESTDSTAFSRLFGKLYIYIQQFETTLQILTRNIDEEIKLIVDKQASSPAIGPFGANLVFEYLQDDRESLEKADEVIEQANSIIQDAQKTLTAIMNKIDQFPESSPERKAQKSNAKLAINEKYGLFVKSIRSKQLGLKFNKVLISRQAEYTEVEDLYNNLKIDMENNVSARPIIAPKAILAGFKMADILEGIGEEFKAIAGTNPLRAEQANKTSRKWENFAKQMRATVFTEIYPGMAQSLGIEATKPSIFPSFSLRGASFDILNNQRFAGKFMDKEVESDKKFRDYWNNLFMQSKDPRPMGDIIEEKPKHGNLTTEEDAKLHKKTMRKFKKPAAKSRFKKN
jgi:Skp family chaperone for outer membrane proteins